MDVGGVRANGSRVGSTKIRTSRLGTGHCRKQAGNRVSRAQLQRLHTGRVAVRGQKTIEHGNCGDSRRLPDAGSRRADFVALRQSGDECGECRETAPQSISPLREQFQLHHRRVHPLHARFRTGFETLPRPRDRCAHSRWRGPNQVGGLLRHHPQLS